MPQRNPTMDVTLVISVSISAIPVTPGSSKSLKQNGRRGSRSPTEDTGTSATNLETRMVTRGQKKKMGMPVEESRHEECRAETSKGMATNTSRRVALKSTGKEECAQATRRAHGDGRSSGHCTSNRPSPSTIAATRPSTPMSPRTPPVSKRGARTKLPSTPDEVTPSTSSGGSGTKRLMVSPLLRTEELPDLEVLHRTEEQVTVRATFPIAQAVVCPLGCEKPYTAVRPDGLFAHQTLSRHFARVHGCHSVQWQYRCRKCNTEFSPTKHRYPLRVVNTHVRSCVSRWEITRQLGKREDLHGVRCDLCDYVGVSKRAVGMHRRRHANENIMQNTGT
ncbi:hypothetical protein T4B_12366, partial [Trichinella pseudospiralis]